MSFKEEWSWPEEHPVSVERAKELMHGDLGRYHYEILARVSGGPLIAWFERPETYLSYFSLAGVIKEASAELEYVVASRSHFIQLDGRIERWLLASACCLSRVLAIAAAVHERSPARSPATCDSGISPFSSGSQPVSALTRRRITSAYFGSSSIPSARRPVIAHATSVVPDPQNPSNTALPALVTSRISSTSYHSLISPES